MQLCNFATVKVKQMQNARKVKSVYKSLNVAYQDEVDWHYAISDWQHNR